MRPGAAAGRTGRYDPSSLRFISPARAGGIETSVLDDGPGRGVRIAWVGTGTPLRYKVLIDRGLDVADAFYGAVSLAFLSLTGPTAPAGRWIRAWTAPGGRGGSGRGLGAWREENSHFVLEGPSAAR